MWEFNDIEIWCISLKCRNDRYVKVCREFKKVNLLEKVKFYRPDLDPESGIKGCYRSHVYCIKKSFMNNKKALVFEDDVSFKKDWKKKLSYINEFLNTSKKWDILRLGGVLISLHSESIQPNIWLCKTLNTEALIYNNKESLLKILDIDINKAIDNFIHDNNDILNFSLLDSMCYQRPESTNIQWNDDLLNSMIQQIIEHKLIFVHLQKLNNFHVRCMKWLPIGVQEFFGIYSFINKIFTLLKRKSD